MQTGMYIGGASPEAVREAREAIIDILSSTNAEAVKIQALQALSDLSAPASNAMISGAHIDGSSRTENHHHYAEPEPDEDGLIE